VPARSTKFVKHCAQWIAKKELSDIPRATRGIYALLQKHGKDKYDVVYIGMTSRSSVGKRLARHKKLKAWSHFSIFEVRESVGEHELKELEGLLREIYRKDTRANRFNKQKKYKKLQYVREDKLLKWTE
jgi:hypothetical protein